MSNAKSVIILIGPPGSGKGTLSALCSRRQGIVQLSTGNLCRQHIMDQTSIGKQIDFSIKSGKLIDDSIISDMVLQWLIEQKKSGNSVILDGFPRTVNQAATLHDFFSKQQMAGYDLKIIKMQIADDVLISRLTSRTVCENKSCQAVYSNCKESKLTSRTVNQCDVCQSSLTTRSDDTCDVIKDRLTIYHTHCKELFEFYEKIGHKVIDINAHQPLENVFNELVTQVGLKAA